VAGAATPEPHPPIHPPEPAMRSLLLLFLGIPIPIIILLAIFVF
jgi:hypothetical protein